MPVKTMQSLLMLAAIAMSVCVMGCASDNVRAPETIRSDPLAGGYPQNIALSGLHEGVVIDKPIIEAATADRPMRVTVPLRSVADSTLHTQYKFTFLDSKGRPVRSNLESWRYQVLAPRAQVFLEGAALDLDAVDWRLEVKPAQ